MLHTDSKDAADFRSVPKIRIGQIEHRAASIRVSARAANSHGCDPAAAIKQRRTDHIADPADSRCRSIYFNLVEVTIAMDDKFLKDYYDKKSIAVINQNLKH